MLPCPANPLATLSDTLSNTLSNPLPNTNHTKMKTDRIMNRQNHKNPFPMILSRHDSVTPFGQSITPFPHFSASIFLPQLRLPYFCHLKTHPRHLRNPRLTHSPLCFY